MCWGDAADELIVAQGAQSQSRIRIIPFNNGSLQNLDSHSFRPLQLGNPPDGVYVTTGDIDADGYDEIICSQGGAVSKNRFYFGAYIQAIDHKRPGQTNPSAFAPGQFDFSRIQPTFGESSNPSGAVRTAAGDIDGDGRAELIVVSASSSDGAGGNLFAIFECNFSQGNFSRGSFSLKQDADGSPISFPLFGQSSNPSGNIYAAVKNIDDDPAAEILIGRGEGAASEVFVYDFNGDGAGSGVLELRNRWTAFSETFNPSGGVHVAAGSFDAPVIPEPSTPTPTATEIANASGTVTPVPVLTPTTTPEIIDVTSVVTITPTPTLEIIATPTIADITGTVTVTPTPSPATSPIDVTGTATATPSPMPATTPIDATESPTATPAPTDATSTADTPPSIELMPDTAELAVGATVVISVTASDIDGDLIGLFDDSANGEFTSQLQLNGNVTASYTYTGMQPGVEIVTLTAAANGLASSATLSVTVTGGSSGGGGGPATDPAVIAAPGDASGAPGFQAFTPSGALYDSAQGITPVTTTAAFLNIAVGDVNGDGSMEAAVGSGPQVSDGFIQLFGVKSRAEVLPPLFPFTRTGAGYDVNSTNEIRVAAGNIAGGPASEVVAAQGADSLSRFRVASISGDSWAINGNDIRASGLGNPPGGIYVAVGDVDGDGFDEVICSQAGIVKTRPFFYAAHLQAIDFKNPASLDPLNLNPGDTELSDIQATFGANSNPSGAIRVAAGDIDCDGVDEILVASAAASGVAGGNQFAVYEPNLTHGDFKHGSISVKRDADGKPVSFALFGPSSNPSGGFYIAAANMDEDGADEIIVGRGEDAASEVLVFDYDTSGTGPGVLQLLHRWNAADPDSDPQGGAHVAAVDLGAPVIPTPILDLPTPTPTLCATCTIDVTGTVTPTPTLSATDTIDVTGTVTPTPTVNGATDVIDDGTATITATPTPSEDDSGGRSPHVTLSGHSLKAAVGETIRIQVTGTDPDGDTVTLTHDSPTGELADVLEGVGTTTATFVYTVLSEGNVHIRFTATANGRSGIANLNINVKGFASPTPEPSPPAGDATPAITMTPAPGDIPGATDTVTATPTPFSATDTVTATPTIPGATAVVTVTPTALMDTSSSTATPTPIQIIEDNPPRVVLSQRSVRASVGDAVSIQVTATDPDGDWITLTHDSSTGTLTNLVQSAGQTTAVFLYNVEDSGNVHIRFTALSNGLSGIANLTITVKNN